MNLIKTKFLSFGNRKNRKNLLFLTGAFLSDKLFYLFIPYLADSEILYSFNKIYFSVGLISAASLIGINYSYARNQATKFSVLLMLSVNSLIIGLIIGIFVSPENLPLMMIGAVASNITAVYLFNLMLNGRSKQYFISTVLSNTFILLLVLGSINLGMKTDYFYILGISISSTLFFYLLPNVGKQSETADMFAILKDGLTVFIINSSTSLAIIFSKYLLTGFSSMEANAVLFAFLMVSPVFIIGNILERFIYVSHNDRNINFIESFLVLGSAVVFYALILAALFYTKPEILPDAISISLVNKYLWILFIGMSLFSLIHFPVNGFLLREKVTYTHSIIAKWLGLMLVIFVISSVVLSSVLNITTIIFALSGYLIVVDILKFLLAKRYLGIKAVPGERIKDGEIALNALTD